MTTIYIDSLFLLNLIINYLLLLLTAKLAGLPFKRWRLLSGAALGAAYAVLTVVPGLEWLTAVWIKCAASAPIVLIALGMSRRFLRGLLVFWVSSFMLAGLILGLGLMFGKPSLNGGLPYAPVSVQTLLLTSAAAYFVLTVALNGIARYGGGRTRIVSVRVCHEGRSASFEALVDTGHGLTDPMTGQPVLVADLPCVKPLLPVCIRSMVTETSLQDPVKLLEQLHLIDSGLLLRLVPYRSVGVSKGWLLAFRPDTVTIAGRERDKLLIGLSPTALSERGPYTALVGA